MTDKTNTAETPDGDPRQHNKDGDTHAHVRYFKLLEVAYNCAQNGHYDRSRHVAEQAIQHYDEAMEGDE